MIVLWTKADYLDDCKAIELMDEGNLSMSEAKEQAAQQAWTAFEENIHQWFAEFKYPPKASVALRSKLFIFNNYLANFLVQRCMRLELTAMI